MKLLDILNLVEMRNYNFSQESFISFSSFDFTEDSFGSSDGGYEYHNANGYAFIRSTGYRQHRMYDEFLNPYDCSGDTIFNPDGTSWNPE